MAADTLDRLLTALAVHLHSFSVCAVQRGWRLGFPAFQVITIHYVLRGSGAVQVGDGPWLSFGPRSVLMVPARQTHIVGEAGPAAQLVAAADHCSLLGDGLVTFTAGDGSRDTLLLCGAISASYSGALALFDLLREPTVEDCSANSALQPIFDVMHAEVASPGFGTRAMTEGLMKHCLIVLLRQHLLSDTAGSPLFSAIHHPRLARAVLAVIENPAAPHTVSSLALLAGMSRASFAVHFSRAFEQGPIDFVQKVRLRIAARLLLNTDLPLKVIAQSVGYAGGAAFSRAFRAAYGADPTSYRIQSDPEERASEQLGGPAVLGSGIQSPLGSESA